MLSAAKHLLFRTIDNLQDSSSPAAPQNDTNPVFFNKLLIQKKMPRPPLARLARLVGAERALAREFPASTPGRTLTA